MSAPKACCDAGKRILETADRLFNGQGIRAVGVDNIAAEIGVSKRNLYNYYPSKDDLVLAYLNRRFVAPLKSERPPREQLLRSFDWLEKWFATEGFRGCPFVNAVAEIGDGASKVAGAFKEERRLWFRSLLEQMKMTNPDALVHGDPRVAAFAKSAAEVLLNAAAIETPKESV